MDVSIVRPMEIVRGFKNIASAIRVKEDRAREFVNLGAPIHMDGMVPYADVAELWEWRKLQLGRACDVKPGSASSRAGIVQ